MCVCIYAHTWTISLATTLKHFILFLSFFFLFISIYLSIYLPAYLSVYQSIYFSPSPPIYYIYIQIVSFLPTHSIPLSNLQPLTFYPNPNQNPNPEL
ncbi:hypothetical protein F4703DRAFT_1864217 [Phycomyces blakesleeanus]